MMGRILLLAQTSLEHRATHIPVFFFCEFVRITNVRVSFHSSFSIHTNDVFALSSIKQPNVGVRIEVLSVNGHRGTTGPGGGQRRRDDWALGLTSVSVSGDFWERIQRTPGGRI
jgi:hypothetical protein